MLNLSPHSISHHQPSSHISNRRASQNQIKKKIKFRQNLKKKKKTTPTQQYKTKPKRTQKKKIILKEHLSSLRKSEKKVSKSTKVFEIIQETHCQLQRNAGRPFITLIKLPKLIIFIYGLEYIFFLINFKLISIESRWAPDTCVTGITCLAHCNSDFALNSL